MWVLVQHSLILLALKSWEIRVLCIRFIAMGDVVLFRMSYPDQSYLLAVQSKELNAGK